MKTESSFLKHISCNKCGSSDANALYDDGHTFCHGCHTLANEDETESHERGYEEMKRQQAMDLKKAPMEIKGTIKSIPERGINKSTCEKYEVRQDNDNHYYPYTDATGNVVAIKTRTVASKSFSTGGSFKGTGLFGQSLFAAGGKAVTICEGELDALAAFQMNGSLYPSVSVRSGAAGALKDCKASFEWLDSFDSIVICFDADEPGQKAAKEVAELFGGKSKVVKHMTGYKDACDYLMADKGKDFVNVWWRAEEFKPEGIVTVADIKERMLTPPAAGLPWCFDTLTKLTYGRRKGELYGFGAGVGVGKTDVFTQQISYDIDVLNEKVGVIYLEQNVVETAQRVAGKLDRRLYHIPDASWTRQQYEESVERLDSRQQLYMMEHFGAMDWASVKGIIRYFAKAYDIKMIYLDHLTALAANEQDERRALDGIMADMASLAQSDGLIIHFVSHLTTPEGKAHEEGGRVLEKHFTGSRAIARWSHYMFGLERDKQASDPIVRQTTTFRVLKDRFAGSATGEKFGLHYDRNTGYLNECPLVEDMPL